MKFISGQLATSHHHQPSQLRIHGITSTIKAPQYHGKIAIWFSGSIPKQHAFHAWVTTRNRLHTRDRLITWGMEVPSTSLFCIAADETRQHLYFDCPYSHQQKHEVLEETYSGQV
ncbi:hypothetical protein YC2023_111732 [Brassica napus]